MAVEIFGLREFTSNLRRLAAETEDIRDVFAAIAARAQADAQAATPVRTGRLRGRIRGSRRSANYARITVSGTSYQRYVHFGAVTVPNPTPFLFIAADQAVGYSGQMLRAGIDRITNSIF